MTAIDTKILPINSLTGTTLAYGQGDIGTVLGVYALNGQVLGLLLEDLPELKQVDVCLGCKYVEYLKECFEKSAEKSAEKPPITKNPFVDYGDGI